MSVIKNVSGGPVHLVVPGFEQLVEDGETVTVPDVQPDGESPIVYPDNRWEKVKATRGHAKDKDKEGDE